MENLINTVQSEPWSLVIAIEDHKGPITVEGLATILGKSPTTIYRMAQRKQLPSHMLSGSRLFDPAALGMHFRKKSPESAAAADRIRKLRQLSA
jgi:excisionase family DNA binding protein